MSKKTPQCIACGSRYGESQLINRYKDGSEQWCFSCVLYHANSSLIEPPMWICNLFRRFTQIEYRRHPWRARLNYFVSSQAIMYRVSKYHSANYNLALWHTYRYKLMYEYDRSVKLIYRDGVTAIKLGTKMVVSHASIWESL